MKCPEFTCKLFQTLMNIKHKGTTNMKINFINQGLNYIFENIILKLLLGFIFERRIQRVCIPMVCISFNLFAVRLLHVNLDD